MAKSYRISTAFLVMIIALLFVIWGASQGIAQNPTQRNPVLEYATGTWCGWCPQGHAIIQNDILPNIPNAIIIGYHGPANGSDPFSFFPGNQIISQLGFSAYPTGIVDRVSGIISRSAWYSTMLNRNSVPATVKIEMNYNFDRATRTFHGAFNFTALQNLSGQFKYNVILLESGMVWNQANGGPNYVHRHVTRAMMNGSLGTEIVNGTWTQGQTFSDTLTYTVPVPGGPGPDIVFDSCDVVVFVYKYGTPLSSNAEIQQAIEVELIPPDYVGTIYPVSPDVIAPNNTPAHFDVAIRNEGLMDDIYYITLNFNGPAGWTQEFTTPNGTFPIGQMDSVQVSSGDSVIISVTVNPNGIDGYGATTVHFQSKNNQFMAGDYICRNVTTTGVDLLVVDANDKDYEEYITSSLNRVYSGTYGIVSKTALDDTTADLSNFKVITWSQGETLPAFSQNQVISLQNYLDNGGALFINGQDIGRDVFESNGLSQFAQDFYTNYLHADYQGDASFFYLIKGVSGDPITNGIQFVLGSVYDKSPDKILPADSQATTIFTYMNGPDAAGIRSWGSNYRVVYLSIGFEQIPDTTTRDTVLARALNWLEEVYLDIDHSHPIPYSFQLEQNYPNPFNPTTTISYVLPDLGEASTATLTIYNQLGEVVRTLIHQKQIPGKYRVTWDGHNDFGQPVSSGIYFYRLRYGQYQETRKMILLR